jgi:23S rRNA pseudouridine1911/1915/1917 synthase
MQNETLKVIYEDSYLLIIDKPAGLSVYSENPTEEKTLIDYILKEYPGIKDVGEAPRYGIAHRLDKETSGIILVAKTNEALIFLQKQFKNRTISKKYLALVIGEVKDNVGTIETLIGRSPKDGKKQKIFLAGDPGSQGKRQAITEYKVMERYEGYTLLELTPKTGRKHQIRCHLAYIHHPIVGDKVYGFKNQPTPKGLTRHFLHATSLQFELPNKEVKGIEAELPEELKNILNSLILK